MTLIDNLRAYLVAGGVVRVPSVAGAGARPWLPPAWKHPDTPPGPGDVVEGARPDVAGDDGLVVSLMRSPSVIPPAGNESRRIDGVDIVIRGDSVVAIETLEAEIRALLVGDPAHPGGMVDFMMGDQYVIQCVQWSPFQPLAAERGVYTFTVGYVFETHAA